MEQQPSILKEIRPHGTKSFPCAIYRTHSAGKGAFVKHHWHEEVELLYFPVVSFVWKLIWNPFPFNWNASISSIPENCTVLFQKQPTVIGKMLWFFLLTS